MNKRKHHHNWYNSYPAGIPHEIDVTEFHSIVDVYNKSVSQYRHRPAYSNFGKTITYGELDLMVQRFANYLICELKLAKGERIAIMMPNCLQYPVALFGSLLAGLTVVNVNPLYTPRELRHQMKDSGACILVVADNFGRTVEDAELGSPLRKVITTGLGDLLGFPKGALVNFAARYVKKVVPTYTLKNTIRFKETLDVGAGFPAPFVSHSADDLAFLQYTGGTTGVSKGAALSHRNIVANMQQVAAWVSGNVEMGKETVVTALPMYHIFALTANCLVFLRVGGHNLLITNPRDMPGFVKELSSVRFTVLTGVNTLFSGLLNTPGFERLDFSELRLTIGAGMAVQRSVAERWKTITGTPLIEGYGMTESSPVATINPFVAGAEFSGSVGLPMPSTQVCVKDPEGNTLGCDEVGELCLMGPQIMQGYWQRPSETEKVMDEDGWLHTGDLARIDAGGYVYIVDRIKDMILVSGFNVYPNEIEDVLAAMPGILEVAVIGAPSAKSGEIVMAIVVRKDDSLSAEEVKAYARKYLTGYKVPHVVEFREQLPKSNVGKILRRELRESIAK
ncbi:AMP-binding protein [Telluria mixta]|uniref:Long-chain-fatty-acid--CoA ligase n=1 Tax=Telluria mixta TaxID=34071 RepID=A0ABT2BS37_9BURK|nr:AMP-binding protein [Telluria mixta]MCS0627938.1 AMP-binding protein [Telluria mixta]WEM93943.1 AMP-binding protein [Telluria mixta]